MDAVILNSGPVYSKKWFLFRSLGAYKIARAIRNEKYSCQVIDFINFMSEAQLIECLLKFVKPETKMLGISTTFLTLDHKLLPHVVNAINYVTDQFPDLKLVFGGSQSKQPAEVNNINKKGYACVMGYGEDIIVELLDFYSGKGQEPIWELYIKPHGTYRVYTSARLEKFNIETDNHLFTEQDCILPNETLPIEISRGCIFKCKFCNHLLLGRGKLDYLRDMELVKNELIHNYERWGTTNYYVICDTFNDTEYKMKLWYNLVSQLPFKIQYVCYLRADLLERFPDVPHMLSESGLISCFHGIESLGPGSQVVGKGWSQKKAREYIPELYHNIWDKKVYQTLGIIIGLPGDTRETFIDTLDWFEQNDLYCLDAHPLHLWKTAVNKNKSEFERDYEKYGYSFPDDNRPTFWKNDYWDQGQAIQLLRNNYHRIRKVSASLGSWFVMVPLQYGYKKEQLSKENESLLFDNKLTSIANDYLENYISKLKSL
jgi:hypothetical protein